GADRRGRRPCAGSGGGGRSWVSALPEDTGSRNDVIMTRLTHYAQGGGCACKIPPGELEDVLSGAGLATPAADDLVVGLETGDDAAVVRIEGGTAIVSTAD